MEGSGFPQQEEAFGVGRVALREIKSPEEGEEPRGRDRILSFRRREAAHAETLIHTGVGVGGGGLVLLSSAAFQHGVAMGGPTEVQPQILGRGMGRHSWLKRRFFPKLHQTITPKFPYTFPHPHP